MSRSLTGSVVAGGVVYPAGTAATPELEELVTNPDHWSGDVAATGDGEPKGEASTRRRAAKRTPKKSESGQA